MCDAYILEDRIDKDNPRSLKAFDYQSGKGLVGLVTYKSTAFPCPIHETFLHASADIALGIIHTPQKASGIPPFGISICGISKAKAQKNDKLLVYGYQRSEGENDPDDPSTVNLNLNPKFYDGEVIDYHTDKFITATWPVYEMSVPIASGVSGSPVLSMKSQSVIGVVYSGWGTKDEDIPHGTATDVSLALDMPVPQSLKSAFGFNTVQDVLIAERLLI